MKNNPLIYFLLAFLSAYLSACIFPAYAKDAATAPEEPVLTNQPATNITDIPPKNNSAANKNMPIAKATLPKKIFSIATAFFIGTPVCIVRRTKYEEWYAVHSMVGDSDNKFKKVLAGTFWLPCAVICGTGEAPFDAVTNGLMYPAFSKDQLSQGKLVQNN